jgi:PBP1b-binding outer membrane lipoprotein LpoB
MKRSLSLLGLIAILAMVLAACGAPAAAPTTAPADEATAAPAGEPTEAPAEEPTEAATEPAVEGGTIKIATQSPLSGPQAALGSGIRNSAELGLSSCPAR